MYEKNNMVDTQGGRLLSFVRLGISRPNSFSHPVVVSLTDDPYGSSPHDVP